MIGLLPLLPPPPYYKDATITYETVAKPVGAVLAELGPKIGMKLAATAEANQEIVIVSVHDVPVKDMMDRLAIVTSCDWQQDGDTYTLKPSQSMRNKERDYAITEATKKIVAAIADRVKLAAKQQKMFSDIAAKAKAKAQKGDDKAGKEDESDDGGTIDMPSFGMFGGGGADDEVITGLLQGVDPTVLAEIGPDERAVWVSNNPNRMQRILGTNSAALIQQWIVKHNASIPTGANVASGPEMDQVPAAIKNMIASKMQPVKEPVAKALLTVQRGMMFDTLGLQINLKAYSAQGKVLLQATSMLGSQLMDQVQEAMEQAASGKPGEAEKKPAPPASTPIAYSPDSLALQKAESSSKGSPNFNIKLPDDLRAKLIHPEKNDPLAFTVTDCLLSYAKDRGKDIIADVPDGALESSTMTGLSDAPKTVADVQKEIEKGDTMRQVEDGKYLLIQPEDPEVSRLNRVDRDALRKLLASVEEKLMPSLDDIAEYALASPPPTENPLSMEYVMLFMPSTLMSMVMDGGATNWDAIRFYGALDPNQKQTLRSGGGFTIGSLGSNAQHYASRFLFSGEANLTPEGSAPAQADLMTTMMSTFMGGAGGNDYREEPTEVMPGGLTTDAAVTCGASKEPLVYCGSDGAPGQWSLGPQEMALFNMMQGFMSKAGADAGAGQTFSLPKEGLLGQRAKFQLTFHVGKKTTASCTLYDPSVSKDSQKIALDNLPSDFKSQVAAETAQLQKGILGSLGSLMPGKQAPPP